MLTPEMRKAESPYKASSAGVPARTSNLDFEAGAYPERKVAKVDPKIYDAYAGQYQSAEGPVVTLTREGDKLIQQVSGGVKNEWLPLSATEFFSPNNSQSSAIFFKNAQGQVTHYIRRRGGQDIIFKKIK